MAKKITKKELESKIAYLERENKAIAEARDEVMKSIVRAEERFEDFKVELFDMMTPDGEIRIMGYSDMMPGASRKRTVTKTQLARRIGRLVVIETEYIELKDRTLPIPKMKVLQDDRDDRRNGGRGSGINVH